MEQPLGRAEQKVVMRGTLFRVHPRPLALRLAAWRQVSNGSDSSADVCWTVGQTPNALIICDPLVACHR